MQVVVNPLQHLHAPETFIVRGKPADPVETPERVSLLMEGVRRGRHDIREADECAMEALLAVHDPDYLDFLENGQAEWRRLPDAADSILPNTHPNRHGSRYSAHPVARAGYYIADMATAVGPQTWRAARASAGTALTAQRLVGRGADAVYAMCRPPGHHACRDLAWGFCYLNNAAVAAQAFRAEGAAKVAIIDIDTHHGNGTQQIFYDRADVLTVSIHVDPSGYPPFYMGYADETGSGDGVGCNLNLLMQPGDGDQAFLSALEHAIARVRSFGAEVLVIATGFDAHRDDPLSVVTVSTATFAKAGMLLRETRLPLLAVQEGGYPGAQLPDCIESFLSGLGER